MNSTMNDYMFLNYLRDSSQHKTARLSYTFFLNYLRDSSLCLIVFLLVANFLNYLRDSSHQTTRPAHV